MGGLNHAAKFDHLGVSKGAIYSAPPEAFTIVETKGHYLHDPSSPTSPPEWMIASIDERGVEQPIKVVTDGARLLVAQGRTRVRAARAANERRDKRGDPPVRVPYTLGDGTDEELAEGIDVENFHRRQTGPVAQAIAAAKYRRLDYPDARIAHLVACDRRDLPKLEAINRCAAEVRDAIRDGRLDWRLAADLAELSRDEQRAKLAELVASGATKGRRAKEVVRGKAPPRGPRLPAPARVDRVHRALADGGHAALAAIVGRLLGDERALDAWPKIREAVDAALAPAKPGPKPRAR